MRTQTTASRPEAAARPGGPPEQASDSSLAARPDPVAVNPANAREQDNIAFNSGEYDPSSPESQHVIAHELAHVRQQTGGDVSMLPQEDVQMEVDPDPKLEREAEETAQRVMSGGELGIQRLSKAEVHVQRLPEAKMFDALALFEIENENGDVGEFQQEQNERRIAHLYGALGEYGDGKQEVDDAEFWKSAQQELEHHIEQGGGEVGEDGEIDAPEEVMEGLDQEEASEILEMNLLDESEIEDKKTQIETTLKTEWEQVGFTDSQRKELDSGLNTSLWTDLSISTAFNLVSLVCPPLATLGGYLWTVVSNEWTTMNGDIIERAHQLQQKVLGEDADVTGDGESQGVGEGGHV